MSENPLLIKLEEIKDLCDGFCRDYPEGANIQEFYGETNVLLSSIYDIIERPC